MLRRAGPATALLLALAAGVPGGTGAPAGQVGPPLAPHRDGEVLIRFRAAADPAAKSGALQEIGVTWAEPIGRDGVVLARFDGSTVEEAIAALERRSDVEFAEPNFLYSTQAVPDDPHFSRLWGMENTGQTGGTPGADVGAPRAWDITTGSSEVIVAIIDTGVDYTHPDLAENIWQNPGEIPDNGVDDDGNGYVDDIRGWDFINGDADPMDDHFHGTHVAGTVGAVGNNGIGVTGMNWRVRLMPLKSLGDDGVGSTSAAIESIEYAVTNGARLMNASWGGPGFSQALRLAIERAKSSDALFVAAAGNTLAGGRNNDVVPFFPASYPVENIIAVAATDDDDRLAGFSNWGLVAVDLAAPGASIYSTTPNNNYAFLNGTSMATPHVSGALALLFGRFPEIEALDARSLLLGRVDPVADLLGRVATAGRLNAAKLLSDPDDVPPAAVTDLVAGSADANRIALSFTATGDDGGEGTASRYDVRYATVPLDESNFAAAPRAGSSPRPGPPGTRESMEVHGLAAATRYWIAVKVLDEYGNRSPLSNVVEADTLDPPIAGVDPDRLSVALFTGERADRTVRLSNTGIGELTFEVLVEGISPRPRLLTSPGTRAVERPGDAPARPEDDGIVELEAWDEGGTAPRKALAGLDREVTNATAADGTVYSYHERNSVGGHFRGIYQLFGTGVHPVYASFWVRPGSRNANDGYFVMRDSTNTDVIFFYCATGGFFYVNADVGGNFDVRYEAETWYHIEFRNIDFTTTTFDFYVDGRLIQEGIRFRFPTVRNIARLDVYSFDEGSEAWWDEIAVTAEEPSFPVVVLPVRGVVPAGGFVDLRVQLDAGGLLGRVHEASLLIASNDPARPELRVPVELLVTGAPDVELGSEALEFGELFLGGTARRELLVRNVGTDRLRVSDSRTDHPAFTIVAGPFDLDPGEEQTIAVDWAPVTSGVVTATLEITSDDPDEPSVSVALRGTGLLPPALEVTPDAVSERLHTGGIATREVDVANTGFSELRWEAVLPGALHPDIETVLASLDRQYTAITAAIPSRFGFSDGASGGVIADGGEDMYDGGNLLATTLGGFLRYSDGVVTSSPLLGPTGRYFTRKYPGLFVFAADLDGVSSFNISGTLGPPNGQPEAAVIEGRVNGVVYSGFVKRTFGTNSPSVNHLLVVVKQPGIGHRIGPTPSSDFHELFGLGGTSRMYYVLWGGSRGRRYDDAEFLRVLQAFLETLRFGPPWIEVVPRSGAVAPGASDRVALTFFGSGLDGGSYAGELRLPSNVPGTDTVVVSLLLEIDAAPDVDTSPAALDFGRPFVGSSNVRDLTVRNVGKAALAVDRVETTGSGLSAVPGALAIEPGASATVTVTFRPESAGNVAGSLILDTNDPDEAIVSVPIVAEAIDPPQLRLSPERFDAELAAGQSTIRFLVIENVAGSDLSFSLETSLKQAVSAAPVAPPLAPDVETSAVGPDLAGVEPASAIATAANPEPGEAPAPEAAFAFLDDFEDGVLDGWFGLPAQAAPSTAAGDGAAGVPGRIRDTGLAPSHATAHGLPAFDREPGAATSSASAASAGIRVSPIFGTIRAGGSTTVEVTIDAASLVEGTYAGEIRVRSNDPIRPEASVPIGLQVSGVPLIASSTGRLEFGSVPLASSVQRQVTILNLGSSLLTVGEVRTDPARFVPNITSFTLAPGGSRAVSVTFTPTGAGRVDGLLTLVNDSPVESFTVALSGTGIVPAQIAVNPAQLTPTLFRGEARRETLTIENPGEQPLAWSITARPLPGGDALDYVPIFFDDMERGAGGWFSESYAEDDLWWLGTRRSRSASHAWTCARREADDYATGRQVSTAVVSPPIDLRGARAPVLLRFFETYQTEPRWDECLVDVSRDGGTTWQPLRGAYGSAPSGSSQGWVPTHLSLTPFVGEIIHLRFYFETSDGTNNAFPGWSFDDVAVSGTGTAWVVASPAAGTVPPGGSIDVDVVITALTARPAATYSAELRVGSNDPLRPLVIVPVRLDVLDPPLIALPGAARTTESSRDYSGGAARTEHVLALDVPPAGPATLTLEVYGDLEAATSRATLTAESLALGAVEGGAGCAMSIATFPLDPAQMAALGADGIVESRVRNSPSVTASCAENRHVVRLDWVGALERLDFGEVGPGEVASRQVLVANHGGSDLLVSNIGVEGNTVSVSSEALVIAPKAVRALELTWSPTAPGDLSQTLRMATNDPARPQVELPLRGSSAPVLPAAFADTSPLEALLPPGRSIERRRRVVLENRGNAPLAWNATSQDWARPSPAGGVVLPGNSVEIQIHFSAADLPAGDHEDLLVIDSNDTRRGPIEIPIVLRARLVEAASFAVNLTPKYADRPGTVEAALGLPAGFDPRHLLIATVTLAGIPAEFRPVRLVDLDRDGRPEIVLQFDARALAAALPQGDAVLVEILGEIDRVAWISGRTFVRGVADLDP